MAVAQRERGELAINTYSTLVAARVPHHLLLVLVVGGHQLLLVLWMHGVHLVQRLDRVGVLQVGQGHLLHGRRVHLLLQRLLLLAAQLLRRLDKVRHASPQTAVVGIICTGTEGRERGRINRLMELLWRSGDFWFLFSVCELKRDLLLFSLLLFFFFFLITLSVKVVMVLFFCGTCIIIELNAI